MRKCLRRRMFQVRSVKANVKVPQTFRRWAKKRLKEEFEGVIEEGLEAKEEPQEIAQRVINSKYMAALLNSTKAAFAEHGVSRSRSEMSCEFQPQSSVSIGSDLSGDDWCPLKNHTDRYSYIFAKIDYDKPVHVRLAGYEALLKSDPSGIGSTDLWEVLLKTLRDGIADTSRPIFEASLQVHAKLLNGPHSHETCANLLTAFKAQYHSKKLHDALPTVTSGINLKIFQHEKLFRIVHLIVRYQEEILKTIRGIDKTIEETIDQFVTFLGSQTSVPLISIQTRTLTPLNIVSVLEPQAKWSRKWIHGLATRRPLISALNKSPNLLRQMILLAQSGLTKPPLSVSLSIQDEPSEAYISGDTVEAMTYIHCLTFLSQLCGNAAGQELLSESQLDVSFSPSEFLIASLSSLNHLASSETPKGIYEACRAALRHVLDKPTVLFDSRFYHVALSPLIRCTETEPKLWPHTLDVMMHTLTTVDGLWFIISEYRVGSASVEQITSSPAVAILEHTSNLLHQPFSVMDVECVIGLFKFLENLFEAYDVFDVLQESLKRHFFPAVTYLYNKMNKYCIKNETKMQSLHSATRRILLKISSIPIGLYMLSTEPLVFEELIRSSIVPLRSSWSSNDIIGFVASAAFFKTGFQVLSDLAPQAMSTLLTDLRTILEDPHQFYDPWNDPHVMKFLHIVSLLSLNTKCFMAFLVNSGDSDETEYPKDLFQLLQHSLDFDSTYHYLALRTLNEVIWNLDIHIYLENMLDFQSELLTLQKNCTWETEEDGNIKLGFVIDECSSLRHEILLRSYYVRNLHDECTKNQEQYELFSQFPPSQKCLETLDDAEAASSSELDLILQKSKPGLRDSGWISEVRKAHKNSLGPVKNSTLIGLLDQIQNVIPTSEWVDDYKWPDIDDCEKDFFFPEELHGIDLALHYAELNGTLENTPQAKKELKVFIRSAHSFIKYEAPKKFESFDWFLATIFMICTGNMEKCKVFVTRLIRCPSAVFVWQALGRTVDQKNVAEASTRFVLIHLLRSIVSTEFPAVRHNLKNDLGLDWWMVCDRLLSQCFWGVLSWTEILHFLSICILYPSDYVLYYCASLLHHCQRTMLQNTTDGQMWPEHMNLEEYHCHEQILFMDRLCKRHRNKVLPILSQRHLDVSE
ncbi:protein broad-minded isoform X2 [Orussus abietinus]|uniref:protein broad-minded isoform X2 n=1 Tax=Orussus abietinus TaxID=222816 RepID=UPI0006260EF3|nr:protein broad-minded isoform X2 [Orussus abietinus]